MPRKSFVEAVKAAVLPKKAKETEPVTRLRAAPDPTNGPADRPMTGRERKALRRGA